MTTSFAWARMMSSKRVTFRSNPSRVAAVSGVSSVASKFNSDSFAAESGDVSVLENPRRVDFERRHFRNMLARIRRKGERLARRKEKLEDEKKKEKAEVWSVQRD